MDDLVHLLPAIRPLATTPAAERLARLRERHWIRHPRADAILTRLEALFEHGPGLMRPPNLLVVGPTNNGKSMLAERFRRAHPATPSDDGEHEVVPVLVAQMPSGPAIRRIHGAVLAALGSPIPAHGPIERSERRVTGMLRTVGVRVLVIDELHNMLAGSHRQQREFLNLLRFLGNELRIPLVALGTREAHIALRSDDQLENRFEPLALPLWEDGADFARLLSSFEAVLPLREPSGLGDDPILRRHILDASGGMIGEMSAMLAAAARQALTNGRERIDRVVLDAADYRGPGERRAAFDAALRAGG